MVPNMLEGVLPSCISFIYGPVTTNLAMMALLQPRSQILIFEDLLHTLVRKLFLHLKEAILHLQ